MVKKLLLLSSVLFGLLFSEMVGRCFADVSAQLEQAGKLRKNKEYEQAEQLYKEIAVGQAGTDYGLEAQERLTCMYVWWGKEAEAQASYEALVGQYSQHKLLPAAVTHVADAYRKSKRHAKACELYDYVIKRWPDDEYALWSQMDLVICKRALKDLSGAEAALEKLRTQYSGHKMLPKAICLLGDNYRKSGQPQKSWELYEYGLANWPNSKHAFWMRAGLAMSNIRLTRFDAAKVGVDKLLSEHGEDWRIAGAACTIANEYRAANRFEEAVELYEYVMDHRPDANCALSSQMGLAISNIRLGRDTDAAATVDKLLADFSDKPGTARAVCWIADRYRKSKKYQKACELYQYVLDNHPDAEQALWSQMNLAISNIRLGKEDAAEAAIAKLLVYSADKDNRAPFAIRTVADEYRNSEKYEKAKQLYQYVADNWPQSEQAISSQKKAVLLSVQLGDEVGAESATEKLLTDFSGHDRIATVVTDIADEYQNNFKKHDKALEFYQHVLENWPDAECAIWAQKGLAISNVRLGNYDAAEAAVEKLFIDFFEDERMATAGCLIADEYRKLEKHEKALVLYQYVVDNWPDAKHAMWSQKGLASSYTALKDDDAARDAIDKIPVDFSEQPKFPSAMFQIGELYYRQAFLRESENRHVQAEQYFQKAITEWEKLITELPKSIITAWAYNCSADCYRRLGQYEKAIEYYQRVVDDWPDYEYAWDALFRIGRSYEVLRKSGLMSKSEANPIIQAVYEQLLEQHPNCKAARYARRWLGRHNYK